MKSDDEAIASIIHEYLISDATLCKICKYFSQNMEVLQFQNNFGSGTEAGDVVLAYLQKPYFKITLVRINFEGSHVLQQQCTMFTSQQFRSERWLAERMCCVTLKFLRCHLPHLYDSGFTLPLVVQDYPYRFRELGILYENELRTAGIHDVCIKRTTEALAVLNFTSYFLNYSKKMNRTHLLASCYIGDTYSNFIKTNPMRAGLLECPYWNEVVQKTSFDSTVLDRFDRLITADFIAENVRNVLVTMHKKGLLLTKYKGFSTLPESLQSHFQLNIDTLAHIVIDDGPQLSIAKLVISQEWQLETTVEERRIIQKIIKAITNRSATLAAVPLIATVMNLIKERKSSRYGQGFVSVGCNGNLIETFPGYQEEFIKALVRSPLGPEIAKKVAINIHTEAVEIGTACLVYQ
ncbi:Glucokinase-1 [Nakaseomyces bracarensis]|uniref:Phosphotransferase n=1 Tax=Nakaseomyces bracarensis TaxID=273131 RepID=A0ABR4NZ30_9SACH